MAQCTVAMDRQSKQLAQSLNPSLDLGALNPASSSSTIRVGKWYLSLECHLAF